jgi:hypothetical protein
MSTSSMTDGGGAPASGLARVAVVGIAVGVVAFVLGLAVGRTEAVFAALAASWLFFAGLAAGSVAVAAAIRVAHGRWAAAVLPIAEASVGFFLPALCVLLVLVAGARSFLPWLRHAGALRHATLALLLVVASAVLFALGRRLVARAQGGEEQGRVRARAVVYVLAYAVVLTIWTFQLVMSIWEGPPPSVLPPYYFLGAFVSGVAWVGLVVALRGVSGPDLRHDVGKLLFAFVVVWSYLLWSLFLPTWYGNLPEETAALLARWRGRWTPLTAAVLIAVFAWPFWLLFTERLKRRRETLGAGAAAVLLGLLGECFLLVLPSLHLAGGTGSLLLVVGVTIGMAGLFLASVGRRLAVATRAAPIGGSPAPPAAR